MILTVLTDMSNIFTRHDIWYAGCYVEYYITVESLMILIVVTDVFYIISKSQRAVFRTYYAEYCSLYCKVEYLIIPLVLTGVSNMASKILLCIICSTLYSILRSGILDDSCCTNWCVQNYIEESTLHLYKVQCILCYFA